MGNEYGEIRISDLSVKARLLANSADTNDDGWIKDKDGELSIFGQKINDARAKGFDPFDDKDDVAAFKEAMGLTTSEKAKVVTKPNQTNETANQVAKEAKAKTPSEQVFEAFDKARGLNKETGKAAKSMKDAYKEVEKEFNDKKKNYTKEQRKEVEATLKSIKKGIKSGAANKNGSYMRDEVERIQKLVYRDIINDKETTEKLSYDQIIEKQLAYTDDKRVRRALKGHHGTWMQRLGRAITATTSDARYTSHGLEGKQNSQAIKNKKYTLEELKALLSEENQVLLQEYVDDKGNKHENVLVYAGLISKDKDGKYDINKFSDLVGSADGKEATYSDHDEDVVSENTEIWNRLGNAFRNKAEDPSKPIMSKLYPDEKNQAVAMRKLSSDLGYFDNTTITKIERTVQRGEKDGLLGGIIGGTVAAVVSRDTITHQDQMIEIPMEGYSDSEIDAYMAKIADKNALGAVSRTAGGILIHQEQMIKKRRLLKNIATGFGIGALIGATFGAVEELRKHSREFNALYLDVSCCDLEGKTSEEQKKIVLGMINDAKAVSEEGKSKLRTLLLLGYVKNSNGEYALDENCNPIWDCCTFQRELKDIGGNPIKNRLEVKFAAWDAELAEEKILEQQEDCDSKPCYEIEHRESETIVPDKADDVKTIDHAAKYGWTNLGRMYSCFEDLTDKQAWRAMQVIQAIDPQKVGGKYREDQIIAVVKKAFADNGNGAPNKNYIDNVLAKEFDFIDVEKLKSAYHSDYAGTEVTPAQRRIKEGQEGYDQVNIVVAPLALYDANGNKVCDRKTPKIDTGKYGKGDGTANSKLKVSTHYTQKGSTTKTQEFRAKQGETVTAWYRSEKDADTAGKRLFPNAERCDNKKAK